MKVVEHRGFVIQQSEINNHFMIYKKIDEEELQWVMHSACTKPLTDDELKCKIDNYIELVKTGVLDDAVILKREE